MRPRRGPNARQEVPIANELNVAQRSEPRDTSPVQLLLVGDDRCEDRRAIGAILSSPGYRIVDAGSRRQALRHLREGEFAAVFVDLDAPEIDAFDVATALADTERRSAALPMVFLTGQPIGEDFARRAGALGFFVDYLAKPLVPEVVRSKAALFAELYRQRKCLREQSARLVESERRTSEPLLDLKATVDAAQDAVFIFDARTWRFLYVNDGAHVLLGYSTQALLGMRPTDFLSEYDGARLRTLLTTLGRQRDRKATFQETRCRRDDGTEVPVEILFQHTHVDGDRIVAIARDITNRKLADRERDRLYEEAVAAVRARDDFLSVASHELRGPLSALRLRIETLVRTCDADADAPLGEPFQKKLQAAATLGDRLARLVGELLDVSRITAGKLHIETREVDLVAVVRDAMGRIQEEAAKTGTSMHLHADGPLTGWWDPFRMAQIVRNLVSNAVKFGAGKPVDVTVARAGDVVRLSVRDHGIGIAPEDLERIFGRFERVESARTDAGMGMGLFIARRLVEAQGGQIRAESAPGAGATFVADFPREAPTRDAVTAPSEPETRRRA
jgi:PAS domain S-box-containing protein